MSGKKRPKRAELERELAELRMKQLGDKELIRNLRSRLAVAERAIEEGPAGVFLAEARIQRQKVTWLKGKLAGSVVDESEFEWGNF